MAYNNINNGDESKCLRSENISISKQRLSDVKNISPPNISEPNKLKVFKSYLDDTNVLSSDKIISDLLKKDVILKDKAFTDKYVYNPELKSKDELINRVGKIINLNLDNWQPSCYLTIKEAIKAANAGDRILVQPGIYKESLTIDKPLEIIGQGDPGEITIQAEYETVILIQTLTGFLLNLTLEQIGEGNNYGINIIKGNLDLKIEKCNIISQGFASVGIYSANPYLLNNKIHARNGFGVVVNDYGSGTLEDNDIYNNKHSGVLITQESNPKLLRNKIHDGKEDGVLIGDKGQGVLEDNEIYNNEHAGVAIIQKGKPTLRHNHIYNNQTNGVFAGYNELKIDNKHQTNRVIAGNKQEDEIMDNGVLKYNEIWDNGHNGVALVGGKLTLKRNKISSNGTAGTDGIFYNGIFIGEKSLGVMQDNDIYENPNGIAINGNIEASNNNKIYCNKKNGVAFGKNGGGTLKCNDIYENKHAGVSLMGEINQTKLIKNKIHENEKEGVYIQGNKSQGIVEENEIFSNKLEGVKAENAQGTLEKNSIYDNKYAGIAIRKKSNLTLKDNKIHNGKDQGVYVGEESIGVLEDNDIYKNDSNGIEVREASHITIRKNRINENKKLGIYVDETGKGLIEENDLLKNDWGTKRIDNKDKTEAIYLDNNKES